MVFMYYSSSSLILSPSSQTKHVTSSLFPGASGQLPPTVHTSPVSVASGSSLFSPHHTPTLHLLFLVPTVCPLLLNTHLSRLAFPQALSLHPPSQPLRSTAGLECSVSPSVLTTQIEVYANKYT